MNISLLEVAMCEKCRSSHVQSEVGGGGGGKCWGGGGGVKNFWVWRVGLPIWGYFCWGVSISLHAMFLFIHVIMNKLLKLNFKL